VNLLQTTILIMILAIGVAGLAGAARFLLRPLARLRPARRPFLTPVPARRGTRGPGGPALVAFGERIKRAARRRVGRFQAVLLGFVLFLPLLLTSILGGR
jgi:hypothetical protein